MTKVGWKRASSDLRLVLWAGVWLAISPSRADDAPLHQVIDQHIAAGWSAKNIEPAEVSSDAEFLRRVQLDLTGVIPTADAARAFLADASPDKRSKLIDSLLASPGYARHMARVFDVMIIERQYGNNVTEDDWREYLRLSFEQNKPWDQLVRELVSADGTNEPTRCATRFYMIRTIDSYRVLNPTHITRDIGRLFLGVNLQCAQCHDHPTIEDYKQADYYGIRAFVERLHMFAGKVADKPAMFIAEKPDGDVAFHSVFDPDHKQHTGMPHLPGGSVAADPPLEKGKEYSVPPADGVMPIPAYSRRAALAAALTSPDNAAFRHNVVNRLWEQMFGRGIIHPVDMAHGKNPPSHPELLEILGQRFAAQKFDIRWLLRELALSKAYQLASSPRRPESPPPVEAFAVAALKPLRPFPLLYSMGRATATWNVDQANAKGSQEEQALFNTLNSYGKPFDELFGRPMGQPETGFIASPFQALFLANAEIPSTSFVQQRPGNLTERLTKIEDVSQLSNELYWSVFTRPPDAEESAAVTAFVASGADRVQTLSQIIWAMICSDEFRFNH